MAYGLQTLGTTGQQLMAAFDPLAMDWKEGGVTLDWSKVAAVGADTVLPDGTTVLNGKKYLRYGQVLTLIDTAEVQTVEFTGGPTAGGAILTLPASGDDSAESTVSISATATAAAFEDALNDLDRIGPAGVSVSRSGSGTAGAPYIYTVTFARRLGDVPQLTSTNTFTGGTTPSVTHATGTAGTGNGYYGPYDPTATDGRQTLSRGDCYIVNETVLQSPDIGWGVVDTDHPAVFDGGKAWKERLIATAGTHSLEDGPTLTELEAAFPRLSYAK
jgi:hypothetical protein